MLYYHFLDADGAIQSNIVSEVVIVSFIASDVVPDTGELYNCDALDADGAIVVGVASVNKIASFAEVQEHEFIPPSPLELAAAAEAAAADTSTTGA